MILVYSIDDKQSFESVADFLANVRGLTRDEKIPTVLVGNKADLARSRRVSIAGKCRKLKNG